MSLAEARKELTDKHKQEMRSPQTYYPRYREHGIKVHYIQKYRVIKNVFWNFRNLF
jgi:hypothetical protein